MGFWRQATDAPYSCKTATTNIWAEYVSEKGGWGCKKKHDNWCQIYHEKIAPELLLTPGGESEVWQKARWLGEGRQRISDIPRSSWCFMKYLGRLDINHFFCCLDLGFNIHPLCLFGRLWDELQPQPAVWRVLAWQGRSIKRPSMTLPCTFVVSKVSKGIGCVGRVVAVVVRWSNSLQQPASLLVG